jgi:organic radical activating enzyme
MNNLNCKWAYNDLFIGTRNNVAMCCMQGQGWPAPDWNNISDINEWYATFEPFVKIRKEHAENIQNPQCKRCWTYENNNIASPRTRSKYLLELPYIPQIKNIEMRFSNKCNLRCRMCDANSSSQIQNLVEELRLNGISDNSYINDAITVSDFKNINTLLELILNCDTIETIELAGGEPFIMPEVEWLLQELINKNKTHLSIKFITNLTSTKPSVLKLLKQFKSIKIDCSIDGIKEHIEYQRYPVQWKTVERNLLYLYNNRGDNITMAFAPCISYLNLFGLPDLIEYAGKHCPDLSWGFNIVASPSYLDFRLIPLHHRTILFERIQNLDISFLPDYAQKIYSNFFNKTIYEYRNPTDIEKQELKDAIYFWDYKSSLKFLDAYPWAEELL